MMIRVDSSRLRLAELVVAPDVPLSEALARLDRGGVGALAVCDSDGRLLALLTDGDIRRAVLRAVPLDRPCAEVANPQVITAAWPIPPAAALALLNGHDINHLPVVDADGVLRDFLRRNDLLDRPTGDQRLHERIARVLIAPDASLEEAIRQIDVAGTGALIIADATRHLLGLVTDGDVRRAILRGKPMHEPVATLASTQPVTVAPGISADDALLMMNQHDIDHLPMVDTEGRVFDLLLRKDLMGEETATVSAVVMAGGLGTRLRPLTADTPKPMVPVGDRPLLARTLERLRRAGIRQVNLTTHYLPERISEHFGDGADYGLQLNYAREDQPLGTAGGLTLVPRPEGTFVVINGDILTSVSFSDMVRYHRDHGAEVTIGVRRYDVPVPYGVVECDGARVVGLREKPTVSLFISAGIYVLEPGVLDLIPIGKRFDMTDLIDMLVERGRSVVSFPIIEYWLDIGRHEDYLRAQDDAYHGRI